MEWALRGGNIRLSVIDRTAGLSEDEGHGKAPNPQRRVQTAGAQEYLSGGTLHGLAKRHNVSRNLIRIWVEKYQAGALDEDVA